jgi:hypothetical protein
MKKVLVIPVALLLLAGCSGAPNLDAEFGKASRESFDMQIANPDYRYADKIPEGTSGLVAEGIMEVYTDDYGKVSTDISVYQLGIETE